MGVVLLGGGVVMGVVLLGGEGDRSGVPPQCGGHRHGRTVHVGRG